MSQPVQPKHGYGSAEPEISHQYWDRDAGPDDGDGDALSHTSLDSDELHETRPNRWRGHPSTWKTWTESDRRTWAALENARRGDLSAHLFNAFALRRGFRVGPEFEVPEDGDAAGDRGAGWDIGKYWTAWPMKANEVPDGGLLPRTADLNEPFTYRREQRRPFAGCNLEDEISATILRHAKERFRARGLQAQPASAEHVVQSIEKTDTTATEGETDASGVGDTTGNDERTDKAARRTARRARRAASPTFTPVISADDERSYRLLRPVTRQIMSKLDDTLMILHNQRMAGLGNTSDSSVCGGDVDNDKDETDAEAVPERRPRARSKSPSAPAPRSRGGRPRKVHVPLEGETEQEMLIRVARQSKRKLPTFSSGPESEGEGIRRRSRSRSLGSARRSTSASSRASSRRSSVSSEANREKLLSRWGLRDWRDVLGAAALAGFSPTVIARAAQRCSTLFREEMAMHTLHERSAASENAGMETAVYVPGLALVSSGDEDESEEELAQLRTVSRQSSVRGPSSSPEPAQPRSRSGTPASLVCPHPQCPRAVEPFPKKSNLQRHLKTVHGNREPDLTTEPEQTEAEAPPPPPRHCRRRSGTPGASHLCPYPHCPRAVEGFTKRKNLTRHLQAVHGKRGVPLTEDEEDSADEMDGGVHVDRFLRPIKIRKGWRGDDIQQRSSRVGKKARAGSEELDSFL
ncbi:hypothetical protein MYCTH_2293968 [Thermothelomyces thermophilus ATCC 42464]|uniref:C2H2-type domain-containing protein n=1 Tax=Thermothelomyces thermophilus (strain ATCC 42464 / BCRC 31852 / DSM 1799) TaxID=573729 RepID=G2Q6R3_THET4|nr:uncharacterized protein MYCTH_2293968 [Thermothelomyces thermophilus ATCC 42464]AEO53093.1 hypothetical protein MYCTH_2293968 [Thermothelomyces thermophilus ATCC 42464]